MKMSRIVALFSLFFLFSAAAAGQETEDRWTVKLMVLGPGPEIYTWWGHTGIIIEDKLHNRSRFYDFGNFSFEEDNFYRNFLMGRLIYIGMANSANSYLPYAASLGRQMDIYTLNISQKKAAELYGMLTIQMQPENRSYLYDHFNDNCSTRIRDYLDFAMDGKLKEYSEKIPMGTFRSQFRRFSFFIFPIDFMLNFLQGKTIDEPITLWDAEFLPYELGKTLEDMDQQHSFILEHQEWNHGDPQYSRFRDAAPPIWPKSLAWGMGCALIFFIMILLSYRKKTISWYNAAWTIELLTTGLLGTMLLLMTLFTDHHTTYQNLNLLYCSPLSLFLLVILRSRRRGIQGLFKGLWVAQTLLLAGVILRDVIMKTGHQNGGIALFFLPSCVLFCWQLFRERPATLASDLPLNRVEEKPLSES